MIENCGVCHHLVSLMIMGCPVYGCGHPTLKKSEQFIVPQHSSRDLDSGKRIATFHRVPMSCPLPNGEANKQPETVPDRSADAN